MTNQIYNLINCQEVLDYVNGLEKQIAEKDKEIEELKKDVKSQKGVADLYLTIASSSATKMGIVEAVRKQVCDEIREELYYDNEYTWSSIKAILDKIEKGVEDGNKNKI